MGPLMTKECYGSGAAHCSAFLAITFLVSFQRSYSRTQLRNPAAPDLGAIGTMLEPYRAVLRPNAARHNQSHTDDERQREDELR